MTEAFRTRFLDFDARHLPKTDHYCCKCQKDLTPGAQFRVVHLVRGGAYVLHPNDEERYQASGLHDDDVGAHPIGLDCARKLGLEWSVP